MRGIFYCVLGLVFFSTSLIAEEAPDLEHLLPEVPGYKAAGSAKPFAGNVAPAQAKSAFANPDEPGTIRLLAGCFDVSYRFVEKGKNEYTEKATEYISIREKEGTVTLRHFILVGGGLVAINHWNEVWKKTENGKWERAVTAKNGDLRYKCQSVFKMNQFRCSAEDAPKPRRDRARTDYETLDREDTLQIAENQWIQAENNVKRASDGTPVATEVGWNEYSRVPPVQASKCEAGRRAAGD